MNYFEAGNTFIDLKSLIQAKKNYETETNNVITISKSEKLKGEGPMVTSIVYARLTFGCKAGKERKCRSSGIRCSTTYKLNCPFEVQNFEFRRFQNN